MKLLKMICLGLIFVLILGGCNNKSDNEPTAFDPIIKTTEKETESEIATNGNLSINFNEMPTASNDSNSELTIEDFLKDLEKSPAAASGMFLSPKDPFCFSPLVFNGEDFEFYYQLGTTFDTQYDVGFMLNGVYQDFKIEHNGNITDYAIKHRVKLNAGENRILKIILKPNIGKSGDVLQFACATVAGVEAKITQDGYNYDNNQHIIHNTCVSDFTMQGNSTQSVSINTSYPNVTIGKYTPILREYFSKINDTDELCQMVIYNDLDKVLYKDNDIYKSLIFDPTIKASSQGSFPLNIAMTGKSGTTQRISLYINDELAPVFDGKYYADVKMEKGKQTTVSININTSQLDTWNNIYCVAYTHDASSNDPFAINQSSVYVLKVS